MRGLPDPFLREDGSLVKNASEWEAHREYIKSVLTEYLYGTMPDRPDNLASRLLWKKSIWDGEGVFERQRLSFGPENMIEIDVSVIRSARQGRAIPVILQGGFVREEIARTAVEEGFCVITFHVDQAAPDSPDYINAACSRAYPDHTWKVIAMWAWLQSRVIDWLENQDFADMGKIVAAGHSRYGKAALCCAIYDERVAACVPAGSGCGGMGCLRNIGSRFGADSGFVETMGSMTRDLPYWFADRMREYASGEACRLGREDELPFDSHFMAAAVAPRALLVLEGLDDMWTNPYGTQVSWLAAAQVYRFLERDASCAIRFREGGHEFNKEDWGVMTNFCKAVLLGTEKHTDYRTPSGLDPRIGREWDCPGKEPATLQMFFDETIEGIRRKIEATDRWCFEGGE